MLVALASLMATGVQAWRARRGPDAPSALSVSRYFRPGINWPGRAIYLVLVFGIVLVSMSKGAYDFGDLFVQLGLILWIVGVSVAEIVVWPGERALQGIVSDSVDVPGGSEVAAPASQLGADQPSHARDRAAGAEPPAGADDGGVHDADHSEPQVLWVNNGKATATAVRVALSAWTVCALLIVATVFMVQKP